MTDAFRVALQVERARRQGAGGGSGFGRSPVVLSLRAERRLLVRTVTRLTTTRRTIMRQNGQRVSEGQHGGSMAATSDDDCGEVAS